MFCWREKCSFQITASASFKFDKLARLMPEWRLVCDDKNGNQALTYSF